MLFNFVLIPHHHSSLNFLGDLLEPIYLGLEELGHEVIRYSERFHFAPGVNMFLEFFVDEVFVDTILRMKEENGDRFVFGVLCTEDPDDDLVMSVYPNRRRNMERVLAVADFVWTLVPLFSYYEKICGHERVRLLPYGYCAAYRHRRIITDPAFRDIDVMLYGNENEYRKIVTDAVRQRGLNCVTSEREGFPQFVTDDLLRRAKVVLDIRRGPQVRFMSRTRAHKSIHCGAAVVAELFDDGELEGMYRYTEACAYAEMAERCHSLIRSGSFVEQGLAHLRAFETGTSMRENLRRAMHVPALTRLGAAGE